MSRFAKSIFFRVAILFLAASSQATAQRFSTVQLPTFQNFSMSTTVSVPDRGHTYVGGINRSFRNSVRRGAPLFPTTSRSFSRGTSSAGVSVGAYIHDLQEMDEAVLSEWQLIKSQRNPRIATATQGEFPAASLAVGQPDHRLSRVSDLRRQVEAEQAAKRAKADYDLAVRLERMGKPSIARTAYRNALKRADDKLREQIAARIKQLETAKLK